MISFESDYTTGCHPNILKRLVETNMEPQPGYGEDTYCNNARKKIREACHAPQADVYFISGGTQTNAIVISSMLDRYEGVIACDTGHIAGHEAGSIEYTGHKVLTIPHRNGKIDPQSLQQYIENYYADENHTHMVFPGMVYISQTTEFGTLYSKKELQKISDVCKKYHLPLFMDGARLGYALASEGADLSLSEIAELCDVFYIGGTKVGSLLGEAVVFPNGNAPKHFFTSIKQHGALLAKGRLLGICFDTLFSDNLYYRNGQHAIEMAMRLKKILQKKGYQFLWESPSNQQFVVMENEKIKELKQHISFGFWEKYDATHTVMRFATSWSTTEEDMKTLEKYL